LADPSLVDGARPGTQVMSVIAQYAPYELRGHGRPGPEGPRPRGDWDSAREPLGDTIMSVLESVAPGIGRLVTHRQVLTPLDLERQYGLTGGQPLHAEAGL